MKITRENHSGKDVEFTVEGAIEHVSTPDAYGYSGQLEKLESENEKLRAVVARLVETIYGKYQYRNEADRLEYILGYGFEVTDD